MDLNPLVDMVEKAKQQKFDEKLNSIQIDIYKLKESIMAKPEFLSLDIFKVLEVGKVETENVTVNISHISYITDAEGITIIHMDTGEEFHSSTSKASILKLIEGKHYVG